MLLALFCGICVSDYDAAAEWYVRLLGAEPSFIPNDIEAVWDLADERSIYIVVRPEGAGHSVVTIFVDNFDERVAGIAERGIEPAKQETYDNGVRKVVYRTPDGNEVGSAQRPLPPNAGRARCAHGSPTVADRDVTRAEKGRVDAGRGANIGCVSGWIAGRGSFAHELDADAVAAAAG